MACRWIHFTIFQEVHSAQSIGLWILIFILKTSVAQSDVLPLNNCDIDYTSGFPCYILCLRDPRSCTGPQAPWKLRPLCMHCADTHEHRKWHIVCMPVIGSLCLWVAWCMEVPTFRVLAPRYTVAGRVGLGTERGRLLR